MSTLREACVRSADDIRYEHEGAQNRVRIAEGRLETYRQALYAVRESLGLHSGTLALFHLRLEADLKTSFQAFLFALASVVNARLETRRSDLTRHIFDTSDA